MRRREFITLLGGTSSVLPAGSRAVANLKTAKV
jgi:hypothetical protein